VESTTRTVGSSALESFTSFVKWTISRNGDEACECKVHVENDYNGSWFKGKEIDRRRSGVVSFSLYTRTNTHAPVVLLLLLFWFFVRHDRELCSREFGGGLQFVV